jgi:Tol biopolymer transport system component
MRLLIVLSLLGVASFGPARLLAQGSNAHPDISPDGAWIVFDSDRTGNGDIYVMRVDGSGVRQLTDTPAMEMGAEWWDGGAAIAFNRYEPGRPAQWYLIDPDGGNERPLDDPRAIYWSWSADGERMLTGPLDDGEPSLIWIQDADGSARRLLTEFRPASFNSDMSFSPDGRQVLFESFIGDTSTGGVYVVAVEPGSVAHRLASGTDPRWSPDGSRIGFKIHDPETDRYWLHVMNTDGSDDRVLAEGTIPRWLPDGRLAYMSAVDGGWQIHLIDVDSGAVTELTR